jgi:hypothetical protein
MEESKKFNLTSEETVKEMHDFLRETYPQPVFEGIIKNKPPHILVDEKNFAINKIIHAHLGAANGDLYNKLFTELEDEYTHEASDEQRQ